MRPSKEAKPKKRKEFRYWKGRRHISDPTDKETSNRTVNILESLTVARNTTRPATSPHPRNLLPLPPSGLTPPSPTLDQNPPPPHQASHPRLTQCAAAMQGGQQVLRSEQKNMEDVQRVREAILKGWSIFTDSQVDFIRRQISKGWFFTQTKGRWCKGIWELKTDTIRRM
jgi:hypothetical protein